MLIKVYIMLIGALTTSALVAYFVNYLQTRVGAKNSRLARGAGRAISGCAQRRMPLHIRQIDALPYSFYHRLKLTSPRGINYLVRRGTRLPRGYI